MTITYILRATSTGDDLDGVRDEFISTFGSDARGIDCFKTSVNLWLDFDLDIFPIALEWATQRGDVEIREFSTREFSKLERQCAPLVHVYFPNCYLWPREHVWEPCTGCNDRGDMRARMGDIPNRIEFRHGIGEYEGHLYLSKKAAATIESLGLSGYEIHPWANNPKYFELSPTVKLPAMLIERSNVYGLEYPECEVCHRPQFRFYHGPTILDSTNYHDEDFVSYRLFMMDDLVVSQKAATRLREAFPKVQLGNPVSLVVP